jgi:adenylate cyclase
VRCRACGADVGIAARFCAQCGTRLEPNDGATPDHPQGPGGPAAERRAGTNTLTGGASTAAAPADHRGRPASDSAAAGAGGDRRIVTALFADLVDYVRLVAEHDAEVVRQRVDAALVAMVDAIQSFDGTHEKFIGDAVFAVFGWPVAHDDDALRATHCALAIRAGLTEIEGPAGESLEVRIGVATGEVVAAPRGLPGTDDWSLTGPAVTTAARIQGIARPGEILLDASTIRATRKTLRIQDTGEHILRGQTRPVRIGRLIGEAGFQPWQPPVGQFVGRVSERAILREVLVSGAELLARGRGATVLVEGEAGMGKSRLLADLEPDVRAAGLAWTWVDNVSYGTTEPYRFARALAQAIADEHEVDSGALARRLLFTEDADAADVRRWAGGVAAVAREASFSGWEEEAILVPPDAADVARDVRSAAVRYFERLIEVDGPRVLVVDDLHWLDPSSLGVFEEIVRLTARLPILVLVGSRPQGSSAVWPDGTDLVRVRLEGLAEPETGELAGAVGGHSLDADEIRHLHTRTGGNPLFIGETVRATLDEGAFATDGRLGPPTAGAPAVAVTIRALLGSRIDALAPEPRTVLRVGSILGMTFREYSVEAVLDAAVEPGVYERLADAAMIVPVDAHGGWRFCHPLIHDAAYSSLLASDRRQLHGRVADRLAKGDEPLAIGEVARHRAASDDPVRAIPLLTEAGERALGLGAPTEAAAWFEAAAELATGTQAAELRARAEHARPRVAIGGR